LKIDRVYAQSVSNVHQHNGLDATSLGDSGINDRLVKWLHSLTRRVLNLSSSCLLSDIFTLKYLILQNY